MQTGKQLPMQLPMQSGCACNKPQPAPPGPPSGAADSPGWNIRYLAVMSALATAWWLLYSNLARLAGSAVYSLLGLDVGSAFGAALEFFIYDSLKILMLLVALIYAIAWLRAAMNTERIRAFLAGKRRGAGYLLSATFGAVTPFCSCSSIPLFLGFSTAGIPIGISMSFLITSPLINEIAVVLLWGLLGWKFTVMYVAVGLAAGIIGGWFMDTIRAGRWLRPYILEAAAAAPGQAAANGGEPVKMTVRARHGFAFNEMKNIFRRVWKWVFIGVGLGAALHGYVPENWFAEHMGAGQWWTVPLAVLVAIPLYSNVTGIVPVMQSLLVKGMPLGTTMAFCMSSVAASLPEVLMLRQIMNAKLQAAFIGYLWAIFTLAGWLFNLLGPYIR